MTIGKKQEKTTGEKILACITEYKLATGENTKHIAQKIGISSHQIGVYMSNFKQNRKMGVIALSHFSSIVPKELLIQYLEEGKK
jgi:hypothetical protein